MSRIDMYNYFIIQQIIPHHILKKPVLLYNSKNSKRNMKITNVYIESDVVFNIANKLHINRR